MIAVSGLGLLSAPGSDPRDVLGAPPGAVGRPELDPERLFDGRNHRPLDRTGQLTVAAVGACLEAVGGGGETPRERIALVVGTAFGSVATISRFDRRAQTAGPLYAKPMDFANSVINAAGGQAAIWHDLRGVNATCCGGNASGLLALLQGCDLLRAGRADLVIAGGVDEHCEELERTAASAGWIAPERLGEASVFYALEAAAPDESADAGPAAAGRADAHDGAPEVLLLGGASRAATGGPGDERLVDALLRAIDAAVGEAGVAPESLAVVAPGTGAGGDAEAAEERALSVGWAHLLPCRVKERTGECLGASSALQLLPFVVWSRGDHVPGWSGEAEPGGGAPLDGGRVRGLVTAVDRRGVAAALVVEARRDG